MSSSEKSLLRLGEREIKDEHHQEVQETLKTKDIEIAAQELLRHPISSKLIEAKHTEICF